MNLMKERKWKRMCERDAGGGGGQSTTTGRFFLCPEINKEEASYTESMFPSE